MGVNNEKEPLSGTTPERRLFDRSLGSIMQHENFTFFNKKSRQIEISACYSQYLQSCDISQ